MSSYRNAKESSQVGTTYRVLSVALLFLTLATAGCAPAADGPAPPTASPSSELAGTWRAVLESPGGELPFGLVFRQSTGSNDDLEAFARNGSEEVSLGGVDRDGDSGTIETNWYDSRIEFTVTDDRLAGTWRKVVPEGESSLPFRATRGEPPRFGEHPSGVEIAVGVPESVAGAWSVEFTDEDGSEIARAEFEQTGERVEGTFLTPTGDYRFLAGSYDHGLLRLSTFDGAHAFLFTAQVDASGDLTGDFWSRDSYHATWTATPAQDERAGLVNGWQQVSLTNDSGAFRFSFPDLEGRPVDQEDPRFDGKVVLVNIFGSWCPNCNDEAPHLGRWAREYRDQGFEVVGLAYEFSGDFDRDAQQVRRFAERHDLDYTMLLAGVSDKSEAAATVPDLSAVLSYPTSVFIGRDGTVQAIHSGFAGPGTGEHYTELIEQFETQIEDLLAASVPTD